VGWIVGRKKASNSVAIHIFPRTSFIGKNRSEAAVWKTAAVFSASNRYNASTTMLKTIVLWSPACQAGFFENICLLSATLGSYNPIQFF